MKFVAIDTKRNYLSHCHKTIVCVWECRILIEIQAILELFLVNVDTMPITANGWNCFGCGRGARCSYFLLELHDLFACVSTRLVENTPFGDALETVDRLVVCLWTSHFYHYLWLAFHCKAGHHAQLVPRTSFFPWSVGCSWLAEMPFNSALTVCNLLFEYLLIFVSLFNDNAILQYRAWPPFVLVLSAILVVCCFGFAAQHTNCP